jgi:hypothetical protein
LTKTQNLGFKMLASQFLGHLRCFLSKVGVIQTKFGHVENIFAKGANAAKELSDPFDNPWSIC